MRTPCPENRNSKYWTVIIKFANRWIKDEVIACQDDLIRTGFRITEHLTRFTLNLKTAASAIVGPDSVKVEKTIVHAKVNGREFRIKRKADVNRLQSYVDKNTASTPSPPETAVLNPPVSPPVPPDPVETRDPANHRPGRPPPRGHPPSLIGLHPIRYTGNSSYNDSRRRGPDAHFHTCGILYLTRASICWGASEYTAQAQASAFLVSIWPL